MKKRMLHLLLVVAMGVALTACGADPKNNGATSGQETNAPSSEPSAKPSPDGDSGGELDQKAGTAKEMVESILAKVEQPALMALEDDMVKELYHFDPALLEEYAIMTPLMNVKTNEISILKVKDVKNIETVEKGVKQRATDVQKQFETYLPDQYENAKNFKLVTKGSYILFVIAADSEADKIVAEFEKLVQP
ncbi:DUF4358 domain-containing protein [Paenibacillus sp. GCM10027627]|uniref:DUF4358 domain-containing protein n=1 Tax=unclassified Paenibacillus TaxID=185978 RepID=UPI003626D7FA